jgi:hypothetical protein
MAYTASVFAVAFVMGVIRVTLVAPRLGDVAAVLLEAPFVLAASWGLSTWCIRRLRVSGDGRARAWMGGVAFVALMALEFSVSVLALAETAEHYVARLATSAGLLGLATQVGFATIPWLQRDSSSESRIRQLGG